MASIMARARGGALKLGPGIALDDLETLDAQPEFISEGGTLVQCVAWFGAARDDAPPHRATCVPADGPSVTHAAAPGALRVDPVGAVAGRWINVPDAALERARLVDSVLPDGGAGDLAPGLGVCVSDAPLGAPWFVSARIEHAMPFREAKVRRALRERDAGIVTVRTRGGAADPDRLARAWRGDGVRALTVFVLRLGQKVVAIITDPAVTPAECASNAPSAT